MTITNADTVRIPAGLEYDPATDPQRRRHLVLAMPWGAQIDPRHAESGGHVLQRGDVLVDRGLAQQGFVNVDHEPGNVGTIVDAAEDDIGVWVVVDLTEEGEQVFAAGNGDVSAEIIQPGLRWYFSGLALISPDETPAIPGSRVVFNTKQYATFAVRSKETSMTTTAPEGTATGTAPAAGPAVDFQAFTTALAEKVGESHTKLTEGLTKTMTDSMTAAFTAALEKLPNPQGEQGPGEVRAARFQVTREEPVYAFNGMGHSLVRDAWYSARERDHDATERIRKYRLQSEEVSKLAAHQVAMQAFTPSSTGNSGQIIPPGYRPDLYVPQLQQGRPLVAMTSQGVIANATPFTVPVFTSVTGGSQDHVEGTNPADGTLTFGTKTVTPGAIDGKLILTREIVDSSNPAIDQIALAAMRESYARQTEAKVYTLLNGANGAGGVITSGFVPSGSQASTYVGTTGTPPAAIAGIRKELVRYPFNRFAFPDMAAIGQNAAQILASAVDSTGRPMYPWLSADNSPSGVNVRGGYMIDGVLFVPAWSVSGVAAGDSQILIGNKSDAWVWESPLLTFRFEEKSGPANIELALFGYFGTHLLRPIGLSGIRLT